MSRKIVIGDVHGGLRGLVQLLERVEVVSSDTLIFLGDLVDGWSESYEVVDFLIELDKNQKCIFIKGNHDLYCENWLSTFEENLEWEKHGGKSTIEAYKTKYEEDRKRHLEFFKKMKYYHIDENNNLFIHAGFTSMHGPTGEHYTSNFFGIGLY